MEDINYIANNVKAYVIVDESAIEFSNNIKKSELDTKNNIIRTKDVFTGTLNSSLIHPREIFREAVKFGSANIIISHNHPSGNPEPSKEDINVSIRIKECGEIMGINLLDHIIIGRNNYTSLKEKGII